MKAGDYVRTKNGHIDKIIKISDEMKSGRTIKVQIGEDDIIGGYVDFVDWFSPSHFIKSNPDILELLEPQDLLYIDIDNDFEGGIIVPRIPETLNELNDYINKIKQGELILKGVVTHERLMEGMFEVNK